MEHSKLVGAVSNCAVSTDHGIYAVRFLTAPTGRRKCPFIFRIHYKKRNGHIYTRDSKLTETKKINPHTAEILFRQGGNEIQLLIAVDPNTGDLLIEQEGISDTAGVYGIQWGCDGLDIKNLELILPARGGQVINASSPFTVRKYQYPVFGRHNLQ